VLLLMPKDFSTTLIGVGGWAYLPIKHGNKLEVCSKLYDFVELNSTYYRMPTIQSVRRWRSQVPEDFEFTVRANKYLTHIGHLNPTEQNFELYDKMLEVSDALRAKILHFQFPSTFKVTDQVIANWQSFFSSSPTKKREDLHLAFEIRNLASSGSRDVKSFLAENDFIPTSDASKEKPEPSAYSKILYTRVFGPGNHTQLSFDSSELEKLNETIVRTFAHRRYVTFHSITMYEDASRMRGLVKGSAKHGLEKDTHVEIQSYERTP